MGISYEHSFVVRDLDWRPTKAHAEAIHAVLVSWRLVREKPELFAWDGKRHKKITSARILRSGEIPDEFVMRYSPMVEGEPVERVLGPLEEGSVPEAKPFIWAINVVLGRDYKVIEAADFGPVFTRLAGGAKVTHHVGTYGVVAATWDQPPPKTVVKYVNARTGEAIDLPNDFSGLMRSGLVIDCDKARPDFAQKDPASGVPGRQFVRALEEAFGTQVVEVGRYL